jgi:myo-inositol catabolism protein IolH
MKVALDPLVLGPVPFDDVCRVAAESGFRYIELCPRADFLPARHEPRATPDKVRDLDRALRTHHVELASLWTVYQWSNSDEAVRSAAERHWRKVIEIAVELGCRNLNSELSGDPLAPKASLDAFTRSIEAIAPLLEREGITMSIEAHPGDFVEDNTGAVDLIASLNSRAIRYLYCAPHTFHLGTDIEAMLRYAAPVLAHVHVADTLDHTKALRFILNPPSPSIRIHQHLNIGEGEVNWPDFFRTLRDIEFDGILTSSVFAWQDRGAESSAFMARQIAHYVDQYWPPDSTTWRPGPSPVEPRNERILWHDD